LLIYFRIGQLWLNKRKVLSIIWQQRRQQQHNNDNKNDNSNDIDNHINENNKNQKRQRINYNNTSKTTTTLDNNKQGQQQRRRHRRQHYNISFPRKWKWSIHGLALLLVWRFGKQSDRHLTNILIRKEFITEQMNNSPLVIPDAAPLASPLVGKSLLKGSVLNKSSPW